MDVLSMSISHLSTARTRHVLYSPHRQWPYCRNMSAVWSYISHQSVSGVPLTDYHHEPNPPACPCRRRTAPSLQGQWNTCQPWQGLKAGSCLTLASVQMTSVLPVHRCSLQQESQMWDSTMTSDFQLTLRPLETACALQARDSTYHWGWKTVWLYYYSGKWKRGRSIFYWKTSPHFLSPLPKAALVYAVSLHPSPEGNLEIVFCGPHQGTCRISNLTLHPRRKSIWFCRLPLCNRSRRSLGQKVAGIHSCVARYQNL